MSVEDGNTSRMVRIRELLTAAFAPESLLVTDDSHRHVGHAGARDGRWHFTVEIVSKAFADMAPLARQRAVYAVLGEMMTTDIHALSMRVSTPPAHPHRHGD